MGFKRFSSFTVLPAPLEISGALALARSAVSASGDLGVVGVVADTPLRVQQHTEKAERAKLSFIVCDTRSVIDEAFACARVSGSGHLHSFRGMPRMPILERSFNPHPARPRSDRPHRGFGSARLSLDRGKASSLSRGAPRGTSASRRVASRHVAPARRVFPKKRPTCLGNAFPASGLRRGFHVCSNGGY